MDDVIRRPDFTDAPPMVTYHPPARPAPLPPELESDDSSKWPLVVGVWLTALVLAGSLAFIWLGRDTLQSSGFVMLGGSAVVALIALITLSVLLRGQRINERRASRRDSLYSTAFFNSPVPSLIMADGKPLHANRAYLDLSADLGSARIGDSPPLIDRLFTSAGNEAAAAIFRLHHLPKGLDSAEETIDLVTPESELKRYQLQVRRLQSAHFLWQVAEVAGHHSISQDVLAEAPVGLFTVTKDGRILATNDVLRRWLGGTEATPPTLLSMFIENPEALLDSPAEPGRTVRTDTRLITRKGVVTPTVMVANWHALNSGDVIASVALYGHSTLARQGTLDGVVASSPDADLGVDGYAAAPVAVLKLDGTKIGEARIVSANPAFTRMSGSGDAGGRPFSDIFTTTDVEHRFLKLDVADASPDQPYDATLTTGEGADLPVSVYIVHDTQNPSESFAYLVNVSARKMLEDQLVQGQKMQAVGQLAAGVAHDFNNLLTAIRLNTDELLQRHPVGDPSYPELQNINTTGARAAALVKKLLTFSRKATRRSERLDVTDTLSDMVVTLRQTLGERAKLEIVHARGLPPVMADKSQIDTVLMNLCVNARDAMEGQGGGQITIRSALLPRADITDEGLRSALSDLPSDDFVVISVADTGTGMSDEVKAKIFEPFFTTKEQGKGTGLGLATVYGIVQQTGGHLAVDSELGQGTTFRIYLPAADPNAVIETPPVKPAARKPADLAGQGNILFVEDEASVRGIAAKALRKKGYRVIEAEDGEEALEILEDTKVPFDLMISDVVMPGMDGPTLLREGRELLGEARIVFISGYAEEEFSELLSEEPDVTFLPKPFTFAELAEKVKSEIGVME